MFIKKKPMKKVLIGMIVTFLIGMLLILKSGDIGERKGSRAIRKNGGSMDTSSYERIINNKTESCREAGKTLAIIGSVGAFMFVIPLLVEFNKDRENK